MRKHTEYKDSGIDWIGEIPKDWIRIKFKYYASITNGKDYKEHEVNEGGYPVIGSGGEFRRASKFIYDKPSVLLGRKGTIDKPLYIEEPFWTVDTMFYTRINSIAYPKFIYYTTLLIRFDFYKYGSALPSMSQNDLSNMYLVSPNSYGEQERIANCLDVLISRIDKVIENKEKLIDLLKEKRQAIITEAVTKGLDATVPMIDSGIEWIGEIPKEWGVRRFKYLFNTNSGIAITRSELGEIGFQCLGYGPIHSRLGIEIDLRNDLLTRAPEIYFRKSAVANENDFIFCDTSEDIEGCGNNVYVKNLNGEKLLAGSHTILARPKVNINSRYLAYLFSTDIWKNQIRINVYGVKVYSVTQSILKDTLVIMPTETKQNEIVDFLDRKIGIIDAIANETKIQIEKLKEYRQSIISEAVTGKVVV